MRFENALRFQISQKMYPLNKRRQSRVFVGFNARVENAVIEDGAMVQHGAKVIGVTIPKDRVVPPGAVITNEAQTKDLPLVDEANITFKDDVVAVNTEFAEGYSEMVIELGPASVLGVGPNPMTSWNPKHITPRLGKNVTVAKDARVIGNIALGDGSTVGSQTSIRGDEGSPILIGNGAKIGNNVTFHALENQTVGIGDELSVGNHVVFHGGLTIGNQVSVGDNAILFKSTIGSRISIGKNAIVIGVNLADGAVVPDGALVLDQATADKLAPAGAKLTSAAVPAALKVETTVPPTLAPSATRAATATSRPQPTSTLVPTATTRAVVAASVKPAASSGGELPWAWILAGAVIVGLFLIVYMQSRRKRNQSNLVSAESGGSMNFLGNFKVGTKIIAGYVIALALMLVVGGLAIIRLGELNTTVVDLTDNLAVDRQIGNDMVEEILLTRFYGAKYITSHDSQYLDRYKQENTLLDGLLSQANTDITKADRVALLKTIESDWAKYKTNFETIHQAILERDKIQATVLDVQGPAGENAISKVREDAFKAGDDAIVEDAGNLQAAFILMRLDAFKYMNEGDPQFLAMFDTRYKEAKRAMTKLDKRDEAGLPGELYREQAGHRRLRSRLPKAGNRLHQTERYSDQPAGCAGSRDS